MIVRAVSRSECAEFIERAHYAKRWPSVSLAFGLIDGPTIVGVVTYGTPSSAPLRSGVCGGEYASKVVELNRLCIVGGARNAASMLVGRSLRMVGDAVVVSYADTAAGHVGYVYQATNWIYTGLSAKRTDWTIEGEEHLHGQTIADRYRGVEDRAAAIRADYGDRFYLRPRPRKHRYVFFAGCKRFRRAARRALRYPVEQYPKGDTSRHTHGLASADVQPRQQSLLGLC